MFGGGVPTEPMMVAPNAEVEIPALSAGDPVTGAKLPSLIDDSNGLLVMNELGSPPILDPECTLRVQS